MADRLTEAQRGALTRLAAGDSFHSRLNFQFCFSEADKYVQVWKSDKTVIRSSTIDALCRKGFYTAGSITPAGRRALQSGGDK